MNQTTIEILDYHFPFPFSLSLSFSFSFPFPFPLALEKREAPISHVRYSLNL